jgi:hypothetical protein
MMSRCRVWERGAESTVTQYGTVYRIDALDSVQSDTLEKLRAYRPVLLNSKYAIYGQAAHGRTRNRSVTVNRAGSP